MQEKSEQASFYEILHHSMPCAIYPLLSYAWKRKVFTIHFQETRKTQEGQMFLLALILSSTGILKHKKASKTLRTTVPNNSYRF